MDTTEVEIPNMGNVSEQNPNEGMSTTDAGVSNEQCRPEGENESQKEKIDINYFHCSICGLHEKFEYFGVDPPFIKKFRLLEETYIIEDPFMPPKQGEMLMLGSHCIKCNQCVCKDSSCSFYYEGTYCINCAKDNIKIFPNVVKDKLNKIIVT